MFDILATPPAASVKFSALAQAVATLAGVSDAYALTLIPPELLSDDDITPQEREAANTWAYEARFDVRAGAGASLEATVHLAGADLGDVALNVAMVDGRIQLTPVWIRDPGGVDGPREQCVAYLADTDWTKIYYETGHAISQGRCYQSAYRDQPFDWKFEPFANYDVTAEKPTPQLNQSLADAIGTPKASGLRDDSLFAYVLDQLGPQGWLASDDGSMEFADFVHIADDDVVTLIHAKAAKSANANRQVSVSSYEVVVGQAVKNLRHLERATLAAELEKGKDKLISKAVWRDGVRQADRSGIIARADALPASYKRRVIVLQPQLTRREHDQCLAAGAARGRSIRMKQLNTLMLAARLSAAAVGADFIGWAAS
ncbi:hypothetical protein BH10PSE4_BH10PSE4_34190 [soil metagenome]